MKITRKNGVGLFFIFCFVFLCVFLLGCFFLFLFFCCFCLLYFCCCFILLCNLYLNFNLRLLKKKSEFKKKKFAMLEPLFHKVAGLLLQNTYGGCYWIFLAANTFSAESGNYCWESHRFLFQKTRISLRSSHWSCSVIKRVLRNFANFTENTCIEVSL